jgi:Peptidase family M48
VSYGFKLLCLSLAAFYIVHAAAAMLVSFAAPLAIRAAGRMRARSAARFLLAMRFAPFAIAFFVVSALCVPSYLSFEPAATTEEAGALCLGAAALCVAIWGVSLARGIRAFVDSRDALGSTIALVGIVHPRVVVHEEVRRVLSSEELDAALRHERAHAQSRDNLKRLLMLLAPDAAPFLRAGFASIEGAWKKFAEWAADDEAVAGSADRSVALASALVAVARLGCVKQPALVTSLLDHDLPPRVNRLLSRAPEQIANRRTPVLAALGAVGLAAVIVRPAALVAVYDLLERLIQ